MREPEKPFVCYKSKWSMKIMPRGRAGWTASGLWMLAMLALTGTFVWLMGEKPTGAKVAAYVAGYTLAMCGWAIAMIAWMKARSEVIDMDELLELKRELDRKKQSGRN
ncbi:MAG: hypothetical protein ACKOPG_13635 [Novosphingobium sp.]